MLFGRTLQLPGAAHTCLQRLECDRLVVAIDRVQHIGQVNFIRLWLCLDGRPLHDLPLFACCTVNVMIHSTCGSKHWPLSMSIVPAQSVSGSDVAKTTAHL